MWKAPKFEKRCQSLERSELHTSSISIYKQTYTHSTTFISMLDYIHSISVDLSYITWYKYSHRLWVEWKKFVWYEGCKSLVVSIVQHQHFFYLFSMLSWQCLLFMFIYSMYCCHVLVTDLNMVYEKNCGLTMAVWCNNGSNKC